MAHTQLIFLSFMYGLLHRQIFSSMVPVYGSSSGPPSVYSGVWDSPSLLGDCDVEAFETWCKGLLCCSLSTLSAGPFPALALQSGHSLCKQCELGVGPGRGLGTPFPQETPNPQPVCSCPEYGRFLCPFPVYMKLYVVALIISTSVHGTITLS